MKNSKMPITTRIALPARVLLWCLIGTLALGQLQRIQLPFNIAVYIHEFVLLLIVIYTVLTTKRPLLVPRQVIATIWKSPWRFFLIWASVVTLLSAIMAQDIVPILYAGRLGFLTFGTFCVWYLFKSNRKYVLASVLSLGVLWAALGFIQLIFLPDTRFLQILGWDEHYYRLHSTLLDPAFTGMLLTLAIVLVFRTVPFKHKTLQTTLFSVLSTACFLTYSRASYGALLIIVVGLLWLYRSRVVIPLSIGIVLATFVWTLAPKPGGEGVNITRTASIQARSNQVTELLTQMPFPRILVGEGLFAATTITPPETSALIPYHARVPDNLMVLLLRGTGLVGIWFFTGALIQNRQRLLAHPILFLVLLGLFWHSQFNNTLLQPFVWMYLLLGFVWPRENDTASTI